MLVLSDEAEHTSAIHMVVFRLFINSTDSRRSSLEGLYARDDEPHRGGTRALCRQPKSKISDYLRNTQMKSVNVVKESRVDYEPTAQLFTCILRMVCRIVG